MANIDRKTVRWFLTLTRPFFRSELRWRALGLVVLLLTLSLTLNSIAFKMNYITGRFMTALQTRNTAAFYDEIFTFVLAFLILTPIVVSYSYTEQRLSLLWRRWLSHRILARYFHNRAYYRLNLRGDIDNPDQRIEADVKAFCANSLTFCLILFSSTVQLFLFVSRLWEISWMLPVAAFAYATLGSLVTYFLGRPLIGLNFSQFKKDADYRYKLVNVRDSAEAIAFYGRETREYVRTRQRLKSALINALQVVNWNRNLQFFTNPYNYFLGILPTLIVAPLFFKGQIEFGSVIEAGGAFAVVINALSIVVNNFSNLSVFAAVTNRLGSFWAAVEDVSGSGASGQRIKTSIGSPLEFRSVTIWTPRREQVLIRDLSFSLQGRSLLISGASGTGKSSILRVTAGLWDAGAGQIIRPNLDNALFLPQRPYMVLGSLRSQLTYGISRGSVLDRDLRAVLEKVRLMEMVERVGGLDVTLDWPNVLGTGEQQKLAFARLFLLRPKMAFLDEATTAMDRSVEQALYKMLPEHVEQYVSTGSFSDLTEFHEHTVKLLGDGTWAYE
jgi:putative ATP-binding cassette transporter